MGTPTVQGLAGSKTEANLLSALAAESRVYLKYARYAEKAEKEGHREIAGLFRATSENERAHGEIWLRILGEIGSTDLNLRQAAEGEQWEWTEMYAGFAETARSEGFDEIAALFERTASVERTHSEHFRAARESLNETPSRSDIWICMNCGYVYEGETPPAACPLCSYPKEYFRAQTT